MVGGVRRGWGQSPLRCVLAVLITLLAVACPLRADSPEVQLLTFEVDQSRWAFRSGAPMPLRLKVTNASPGILEGILDLQFRNSTGVPLAAIRLPDQVYSTGRRDVDYLIPLQAGNLDQVITVSCAFHARSGEEFVSEGMLVLPNRRSFVVPMVVADVNRRLTDDFSWLSLESYCPANSVNADIFPMVTLMPRYTGADMPRDPLKHMAHDIVVIHADGFRSLQSTQIQALEAWLRGGGSAFVQLGAGTLSAEQQGFIDRLVSRQSDLLSTEFEGRTLIPVMAQGRYAKIRTGFGCVVLTTERSWAAANPRDRLEVFGFLWRIQNRQMESLRNTGKFTLEPIRKEVRERWAEYARSYPQPGNPYAVGAVAPALEDNQDAESIEQNEVLQRWGEMLLDVRQFRYFSMFHKMMPKDVRVVPVWLLSAILLAYIVVIGWGDYLVLGRLKRRRWTWFTFPATTLLVTLLTIGTAKGYLGSTNELSVVEFRDIADDGQIARVQRFELHFPSSSARIAIPLNEVVFTPLPVGSDTARGGEVSPLTSRFVSIQGVPTLHAEAIQELSQWRPQLNRMVSFPRHLQGPFSEADLPPCDSWSNPDVQQKVKEIIHKAIPQALMFRLYRHPRDSIRSVGDAAGESDDVRLSADLADECTCPSGEAGQFMRGIHTLFDEISPSADIGLEDTTAVTPGHPVLCVSVREPTGELVIYRWVMNSGSKENAFVPRTP